MNIGFDAKRAFLNKSGLGNYSRFVIQSLGKYYHSDSYFLFTPDEGNIFTPAEYGENTSVVSPQKPFDKLFRAHWRSKNLKKESSFTGLDIFHGLSGEIPHGVKSNKPKLVVTIHDLIFLRFPHLYKPIDRKIYSLKFGYACKHADTIIAVSQQTGADICEFLGVAPDRIKVIYQSCHERFYTKATETQKMEVAAKYKLPQQFALYVGTIEKRKNLLSVIKAMHTHNIDLPLVVVGRKTDYYAEIESYIQKNRIDFVHFPENLTNEDLPAVYQLSAMFIYPSVFEGFGIPVLEALFSGTPVITSKGSCFAEAGGPHSLYVEHDNSEEIAQAMEKLISDESYRQNMIQQGYVHCRNFMPELLTAQLMETYKLLLND